MKKLLILPLTFLLFTCLSFAQTLAPGAPGKDAQWATAGKQGVGTAASLESKVWFTLAQGVMTEVYYPDVMTANVHLLQFVVVNPKTKKVETEQDDAVHEVKVLRPDSLTFQQVNTAKSGEWKITKTYTTDVERDTILINVNFESENLDLIPFLYYDPSLNNSGMHDTAWAKETALLAQDKEISSAIETKPWSLIEGLVYGNKPGKPLPGEPFNESSNGFFGVNDGLTELRKNGGGIYNTYFKAENGNVVQMIPIRRETKKETRSTSGFTSSFDVVQKETNFIISLGFGKNPDDALSKAKKSLDKGFQKCLEEYEKGWSDYVKTLRKVEPKYQAQFNMAAMILKAHEDKTKRGANIASLTVPWGGGDNANENNIGGYHLVWSRDLYQVATAFMALGDTAAANRALDFVFNVQQKPDGSVPQNSKLDGTPFWGSLQLDEVAFPLILAYQLKRFDKPTWENHVKKAADFIVKNGPKTPQERWEEEGGYSPSTIAAEIAGLVCAAEIARKNGDETSANLYLKTADEWKANVEKWTVTTNGKLSKSGGYYVRITQNGKPDAGEKIELNNGAGFFDEREIVDAGFLELVRLGIKSPDDAIIQNSVKVIDENIRVRTPNGDAFYRYNHDGYGEMDDGRRWNFDGKYTGKGRLWALLSGERGQYELAMSKISNGRKNKGTLNGEPFEIEVDAVWKFRAQNRLEEMQKFANEGLMIPEQIWDSPNVPKTADKQFVPELKFGEGTGSATPLAWSMAQFIRLAVNLQEGKNLDTPDVVYNRYVLGKKSETDNKTSTAKISECETAQSYINNNRLILSATSLDSSKFPKIWGEKGSDSSIMRFAYFGSANDVEIVGDFTGWKPCGIKLKAGSSRFPDNKYLGLKFPNTARVEYKLIVDGKWITDPLNPNKVDNGVGGENSYFTMPDYKPTVWDKGETPKLETIEIDSKVFGDKRKIQIYMPPENVASSLKATDSIASGESRRQFQTFVPTLKVSNFNAINSTLSVSETFSFATVGFHPTLLNLSASPTETAMPVLYFQDGMDYINRANAVQIQQNLVKANKIKPFMMVFLDPKDRMKEYWANDDYAKFLAEEVVPAIDAKYNTIKSRDGRIIMGASLGGITSVYVGLKYPNIFGRIGGQSSSFWIDNERVVKGLEKLDGKTPYKFYFDDGTLEGVEDSRKAVEILRKKGYAVTYIEAEAGHNWTAWRDRLADAFVALMN